MPHLKLQIEFNPCNVDLIETTNPDVVSSVGRMEGPAQLISAKNGPQSRCSKEQVHFFLLVWKEDGEGWNHKIKPVSFEKNGKVIKIQDTNDDQWVFAITE